MRTQPTWLVPEPFIDADLGVIKSGKEAQISLVERIGDNDQRCLLARKRYLPREVKSKGVLEEMGVQRASTFRNDVTYREGRQFRKTRDRRAVEQMTAYGKRLLQDRWTGHEHEVMGRLWDAGMSVPYPISFDQDVFDLAYIGDETQAAPQLQAARLSAADLKEARDQLVDGLRILTSVGLAHGDLSPYNLLWWHDRLWFIDFPQAVDLAANPQGLNYLHADATNVARWFTRKGLELDGDELFADLLSYL